ncbi:MAG: type I-E CRISPR-associated protein Cas5/CasD [Clostridiales Family XIII bacterium]|jgi:CRISPR system Cascade subunit CasD|nr:type I-E CRISPR-associated protein Cas5/CasD [Clostridiales Family XIII bacterium]
MRTLLLRLAAPLQSWGADSKFTKRVSRREPTKSGVIGLCACAMGIRRGDTDAITALAALRFGVRIDQPGTLLRDYHTAHKEAFWTTGKTDPFVSERYYLADAVFLAGLSGDDWELPETIEAAMGAPKLPLSLGRRSCPPTEELSLGLRDADLKDALCEEPWHASEWYRRKNRPASLEIVCDAEDDAKKGILARDLPLSFHFGDRRYGLRFTVRTTCAVASLVTTAHDPFTAFGGDL